MEGGVFEGIVSLMSRCRPTAFWAPPSLAAYRQPAIVWLGSEPRTPGPPSPLSYLFFKKYFFKEVCYTDFHPWYGIIV